jgi:hypothetical protein
MHRCAGVAALIVVLSALAATLTGSSKGAGAETTTIDLTLRCTTLVDALGKRVLLVNSSPDSIVTNPSINAVALGKDTDASELLADVSYVGPRAGPPGVLIHDRRCRRTSMRIPLSAQGLPRPATEFYAHDKCNVGREVLIRVRAVLEDWKGWTVIPSDGDEPRKRDLDFAQGKPVEASLAVRTLPARKPISFASLDGRARAKFFTANWPRCGHP